MKRIIRLTEKDLTRLVKRVISETYLSEQPVDKVSYNQPSFSTFLKQKGLNTSDGKYYFTKDKKLSVISHKPDNIEITLIGVQPSKKDSINKIINYNNMSERFIGDTLNLLGIKEYLAKEIINTYLA